MVDRPLTRAEWVDRRLREAIITGELQPGEKLITEELARAWDVSPTPLRETYQRLAAEGLIDLTPQRGARVAAMSYEDALDVYATRLLLEPHALRCSLDHRDDEWRDEVRATYEPLRGELEAGIPDLVMFEDAHSAFHEALLSRCGSPWLLRLIQMLQGHSVRYRLSSLAFRGGAQETLHEHDRLIAACLDDVVDRAVELLTNHLQITIDSIHATSADELLTPRR